MQILNTYSNLQYLNLQVLDPQITKTRNRVVYSRDIKVYSGIDNPIQIFVKNQDQKIVDVTGYDVIVEIQDPDLKKTVAKITAVIEDPTEGYGIVTISKSVVAKLEKRYYKIATRLVKIDSYQNRPLYNNDDYDVWTDLEVLPGWYTNS
jgi:hypothetical protein